jgi:hypothetical protein
VIGANYSSFANDVHEPILFEFCQGQFSERQECSGFTLIGVLGVMAPIAMLAEMMKK